MARKGVRQVVYTLRMSEAERDALAEASERLDLPVAHLIRVAIRQWLEKNSQG